MKWILFMVFIMLLAYTGSYAQKCKGLKVDLVKGTINGLGPKTTQAQFKKKLPCFTGSSEEGSAMNCGGGLFYLNHNFFCYTGNDYIEIREKFKGNINKPLLGKTKEVVLKLMKAKPIRSEIKPKGNIIDDGDNVIEHVFYKTKYGCLRIEFNNNKAVVVAMHAKAAALVKICY